MIGKKQTLKDTYENKYTEYFPAIKRFSVDNI